MLEEKIHNYTFIKKIGQGGMAEVFEVKNALGRRFAAKKLLLKYHYDEQICERFIQEARFMVQLQHKNIFQVFD